MDSPVRIDAESLLNQAPFVQRLAKALVRRADLADDVAQDVFVAALQQRSGETRHLRGWLAAVTKRLARRTRAAEQRRSAHETNAAHPAGDDRERHTAERLQLQRRLCDAVFALPEPYRTTVTLRFFDELTPRTIAARLAVPSDVVRQRLHRGLVMLRQQLDRDFGDRRAWIGAFAAAGLGFAGSPWLLLTVLTMNKLLLGAAAMLVGGAFFFWPDADPPLTHQTNGAPGTAATHAAAATATEPIDVAPQRTEVVAAAEALCELLVVDDAGNPVRGAVVHLWRGDDIERQRKTDERGRCSFAPSADSWDVLVCAEGRFPHRGHLDDRRGERRIVLLQGATVSGLLLVDGEVPRRSWTLSLDPVPLGDDVPKLIQQRMVFRRVAVSRTAADGTFVFRGLPISWRGGVCLPQPLWLLPTSGGSADNDDAAAATAGTSGLRLETTQLPLMQCRVIWDDDGTPAANADAVAYCDFADGSNSPSMGVAGDEAGDLVVGFSTSRGSEYARWCDPAQRPAMARVTLSLRAPGSDGSRKFTFEREDLARESVHVLRLPRALTTHFLAIDEGGAPIHGARVSANGISESTTADGRGTFSGTSRDVKAVGAPLHHIGACAARAPAAGTADDPLVFVLPRSNAVRIRVAGDDGKPPQFLRVELHSPEAPFPTGALALTLERELGNPVSGGHANVVKLPDGGTSHRDCVNFVELDEGVAVLRSLVPERTSTLVVFDSMHRELARAAFTAPPAGEEIAVDLHVPGTAREVRGRVVNEAGNPVAKAKLRLAPATGGLYSANASTDDTGHFCMRGVYATEPLRFTITASGFVVQQHDLLPPRDDDGEQTFQLERGLPVTVRVVDENGDPVPISPRLDETSRLHDAFDDVSDGVRRWRALPPQPVTFHCRIGGATFSQQHDPRQPDAVLRVPKPGRLVITAPGGWPPQPETASFVAKVQRLDAAAPRWTIWSPEDGDEELLVPGRYRIELFVSSRPPQGGEPVERSLGLAAEVTLHAGSVTRAELR